MNLHAKNAITQDDVGRSVKIADRATNEVVLRGLDPWSDGQPQLNVTPLALLPRSTLSRSAASKR
jgi:hypothetical protein